MHFIGEEAADLSDPHREFFKAAFEKFRVIVRENQADLTDRGQPIPSIFWPFNTFYQ